MLQEQKIDPDLSRACEDVTGIHAEAESFTEIQSNGILGVDGVGQEGRSAFFRKSDGETRNILHRRWDIFDRGETQADRLQKLVQEGLSSAEYASDTRAESASGVADVWYGGYRYG